MNDEAKGATNTIGTLGKKTQDTLETATKKTESSIKRSGALMRRMASQLYSDFKALMSLESLQAGLKLSNQFKGAVTETVKLSDTVRRLGGSFGIARDSFGKFHGALSRGLGDIGASSEAAANALQGLAGLGVKGEKSAVNLSKGAVTLAGMSGEKGNEQSVARLLGTAIQATGKDINDEKTQKAFIGEVTAAVQATGQQASVILQNMNEIFSKMPDDLRKKTGPQSMAQMAVMASTVGPMATAAIAKYMSMSKIQRMAMEAQGFNIMGKNGSIDIQKLQDFIKNVKGRTGMDARQSLQTAGFSEDEAEGLVRLGERADDVAKNLEKLQGATRDNEEAFHRSMGMLDAFKGSINTVKGRIEQWSGGLTQTITDFLSSQVGHVGGSTAVVAGGATLAAILAGGGLRGIGKGLFGAGMSEAKLKAEEAITGEHIQKVYVTNASDFGGMGAGAAAGGMGMLGKAGAVLGAAGVGAAVGEYVVNPLLDKYTQGKNSSGFEGNAVERMFDWMDQKMGGRMSGTNRNPVKVQVQVHTTEPNLKAKSKVDRGAPTR